MALSYLVSQGQVKPVGFIQLWRALSSKYEDNFSKSWARK
jgi:hypothetical protein